MYAGIAPLLGTTVVRQAVAFSAFTVAGSQVVSNVPFVLVARHWLPSLAEPRFMWLVTAVASTLAGNLTVLGSVANVGETAVRSRRATPGAA